MARIDFYEKPGCTNNIRQKALLAEAGHEVIAHDLLAERWSPAQLRPFFGDQPVAAWFNPTAPRIKSGEVDPAALDETAALAAMCADPLLIRRPLLAVGGERRVGFDGAEIDAWIGLSDQRAAAAALLEICPRPERPCTSGEESV